MAIFWSFLYNVSIVLFVINGLIWFREKRKPSVETRDRALFGTVTRSFGGADFLSAVLVVLANIAGAFVANAFAGPVATASSGVPAESGTPEGSGALPLLVQATTLVANWVVISWRNDRYLDWTWSGVAALSIFAVSLFTAIVLILIGSL